MRVALVNDLPLALEALRRSVARIPGASVAWTAVDGVQALAECRRDRPDLVLMDLRMEGLPGPEAVAAINRITEGVKAEVHLHCCHSVYKRQSDVIGDYKPILPRLKDAKIDRINLEFAYHGTGNVDDLKLLPANVDVGMGVVDVRSEVTCALHCLRLACSAACRGTCRPPSPSCSTSTSSLRRASRSGWPSRPDTTSASRVPQGFPHRASSRSRRRTTTSC